MPFPRSLRSLRSLVVFAIWLAAASTAAAQPLQITTAPDLGTHSAGPLQLPLFATGGTAPYTWGVTAGALPAGVALRADGPTWFPFDASAGVIGVTTAPGVHNFTLTVTDSTLPEPQSVSQAFSLTVVDLRLADNYGLPDAYVDEPYDYEFTVTGASGSVTLAEAPLPDGLSLVDGHLTGTPTTPESRHFQVAVTDDSVTVHRGFDLNIFALRITKSGALPPADANVGYSTTLTATGGSGAYTWQSGGMPSGFDLSSDGTLTVAPTPPGQYFFSATVSDGTFQQSKNFILAVVGAAPTLPELPLPVPPDDFTVGEPRSLWINANGGVPPYTFALSGVPPELALRVLNNEQRQMLWPNSVEIAGTALAPGTYTFQVSVTDSAPVPLTVSRPVTLRVSELTFDYPQWNPSLNTPFSTSLRVIGGTGSTYAAGLLNPYANPLPTGAGLDGNTLTFSGTPLEWGGYHAQLEIDDGNGHTLRRGLGVFVGGNGSNVNIGTFPTLPDATRNQFYSFGLWSCCAPNVVWSEEGSHPLPAGLSVAPNGIVSGTPTSNGLHTFRVRATDADDPTDFVIREFHLNVTPVMVTMNSNLQYANQGAGYQVELAATGGAGGFTWTVAEGNELPPGLALVFSGGEWTLEGTPTSVGRFSFHLQVTDQLGSTRTQFFSLEVYPAGAAPPVSITMHANLGMWSLGHVDTGLFATGGDNNYSWSAVDPLALPPGVIVRPDAAPWFDPRPGGALAGIATTPGTYTFDLTVTSAGLSDTRTFTVQITDLEVLDPWHLPDAFVGHAYEPYTFATTPTASPVWTVSDGSTLPDGLQLDTNTGTLFGTPMTEGTYQINLTLDDGARRAFLHSQLVVWAVRVDGPSLIVATQNEPFEAQFTASPAGAYQWSVSGLPFGMTLDQSGLLSGTPTFSGTHSVTITATDTTTFRFYSKRVTLSVRGVPATLPSMSFFDPDDWTVGQRQVLNVNAWSGEAPYTWSLQNLPPELAHIRIRDAGTVPWSFPEQAEIFGVVQTAGTYTFDVSVTDSSSPPITVTRPFTIRVSELMVTWFGGFPLTFGAPATPSSIRVIGGNPSYDFAVIDGKLPAGTTLSSSGTLGGTPLETDGTWARLLITDDGGRELRTGFGLFVAGGGFGTVDIHSFHELNATLNQPINQTLFACCLPAYEWMVEPGEPLPPGVNLSEQGVLSGTPTSAGEFRFRVRVFDPLLADAHGNFAVREFVMTVTPLVYAASTNLTFANVGGAVSHELAAVSGAGGPVTWSESPESPLPPGLQLTFDVPTGKWFITGTPASAGQFHFSLVASDGTHSRNVFFNVSIYPEGQNPPVTLQVSGTFGPIRLGRVHIHLPVSGGVPPYHVSYVPGFEIPGVRVQDIGEPQPNFTQPNTGSLLGIIAAPGTYQTRIRAEDSAGGSIERDITVIVSDITVTTPNPLPDASLGVPYSQTLQAVGGSGPYLWTLSGGADLKGLTLSPSGELSGTPTGSGNVFLPVSVTDGATIVQQFFNVTIHPFAITSNAVLPIATQGEPYATMLTGTACPCTWSFAGGLLPSGVSLNSDGLLSGTPNTFDLMTFVAQAEAADGRVARKTFTLHIQASTPQPVSIFGAPLGSLTVGQQFFGSFHTRGGVPPYHWSIIDGAVPPGLALVDGSQVSGGTPSDIPFLSGVPTEVGTYTLTLQAADSGGNPPATRALTIVVSPLALEYHSLPLPGTTLRYGAPYSQRLLAIGGSGSYTWSEAAALPTGLTLSSTDLVTGAPLNTGSYHVPIQVTDAVTGDVLTRSVSFNIASNTPHTLTINNGPNLGVFARGFTARTGLFASGGPSSPPREFTFSFASPAEEQALRNAGFVLLSGDSFPSGPGGPHSTTLAGTPLQAGTFTFTLEVRDQDNNFGAKTFTLTVAPVTPFTGSLPHASTQAAYAQQLHAWGDAIWVVAPGSSLPPGMSLVNGALTGTPTAPGDYSFVLLACDTTATTCVQRQLTLHVAPLALTDSDVITGATVGVPFSHEFATAGGGGSKTFTISGPVPPGFTLAPGGVLPGGALAGTPAVAGSFTFSVEVTDGVSTFAKAFVLHIVDPYPALVGPVPSSGSETQFATVGQSFFYTARARLGTPPYTWTLPSGQLPDGLQLYSGATLPAGSTSDSFVIAGAPTTVGTNTVQLQATDQNGQRTVVALTIVVSPLGFTQTGLRPATYNTPYAQQLVVVGGTPPYQFALADETTLATGLSLTSDGLISGSATDTGNNSFVVSVTDGAGSVMRRSYSINVNAPSGTETLQMSNVNFAPVTTGTGLSATFNTGPSDPDTAWVIASGAIPPGMQLLYGGAQPAPPGTAVLAGAPSAPGVYTFTLQATRPGAFGERRYTMHVTNLQIVPTTVLPDATVGAPYLAPAIRVVGGTAPQFTIPPTATAAVPTGLSLDPNTGVLSGTPSVPGSFVFPIRIVDGGSQMQRNFGITIADVGDATPLRPVGFTFADASIGVPLAQALDFRAQGGVQPYAWSHGGDLPAGLSIVPGAGPLSAHLIGAPTVAGLQTFTLTVQDASGQSATATFRITVSPIRMSPEIVPTALVGSPYSLTLTPAGGTGPYTITPSLASSVPPNLTRSIGASSVTVSGTPAVQGRFGATFFVTDSAGATLTRGLVYNVDALATPTPYLAIGPTSIQITHVAGSAPSPFPVQISSSSAPVTFTAMLMLPDVPGSSLSVASGTTPRTTNISLDAGSLNALAPGTYYGVLAVSSGDALLAAASATIKLTVVPPPPCEFTLGATSATFAADLPPGGQAGGFALTATGGCSPWTATSDSESWLRVDTPSGSGSATIDYTVLGDNTSPSPRVGIITVAGKDFKVTQFGLSCSFVLSPTLLTPQAAGGTDPVIVNASQSACTWTASEFETWITLTMDSGVFFVNTTQNPDPGERTGTVTLFDSLGAVAATVTVRQAGIGCGVTLSDSGVSLPADGDVAARSSFVDVTHAPCGFSVVAPPQVSLTDDGSISNRVAFTVAANISEQARTLTLQIGDKPFVISQPGLSCNVNVGGSNPVFAAAGGAGSLTVTANVPTCDWSAAASAPWLIINSGHLGSGSGGVTFSVAANSSALPRAGTITVAGKSMQINQDGVTCSYSLRSESASVPSTGGSGTVGVIAANACSWSATTTTPWLAITSSDNAGTGSAGFIASANTTASPRIGTIAAAGKTFTVTQAPAPCSFALSTSSAAIADTGGTGSFSFASATTGCSATAQPFSVWIETTTTPAAGGGTVDFTVQPNPFGITRTGRILVGDQTFTITQSGAACGYSFHAPSATFTAAGGSGDLLATATALTCSPAVGASPEITLGQLTPPPPGFVQPYTVAPFVSSLPWVRTLTINFGGINFAVKQTSW